MNSIKEIISCISKSLSVEEQALLAPFSTFKIGGPADVLVRPRTIEEVQQIFSCVEKFEVPFEIIGGGSNILISDEGFRGVVLLPQFTEMKRNKNEVQVGSSVGLQRFLQWLRGEGLSGLEHMVGIPGSVGGALAGNAGTAKEWIDSCVKLVQTVNTKSGAYQEFSKKQCGYEYRYSRFKENQEYLIIGGIFELTQADPKKIAERMKEYLSKRNKQPAGSATAGCVFKNPQDVPAGKLIDELGLKGKRIGDAQISTDHGNFMLNLGNAKATDIIKLVSYVKQQARDKRGIQLQEEIRYIGF